MSRPKFQPACQAVLERLERELLPELTYHSAAHTRKETLAWSRRLALREGVRGLERQCLLLAACYHDLGMTAVRSVERAAYRSAREVHEAAGAQMAADELPQYGYGPEAVALVQRLVLATRSGHAPQDRLEQIIRDADLSSLGAGVRTFWRRSDDLRREWQAFGVFSGELDWWDLEIRLLENHRFYTAAAQRLFDANRLANLASARRRQAAYRAKLRPLKVLVRPAQDDDTPAVMELTRTIWGGGDYIPYVWAEWLADPHGRLVVAEADGRVVGLGKLTRLSDQDWWMEGMRVDPQFQGRGVASQLHAGLMQTWQALGGGTLRLATSAKRYPIHHLCERSGFTKAGEFLHALAPALAESSPFEPLTGDLDEALAFFEASPVMAQAAGLMDLNWQFAPLRREFLAQAAAGGRAWRHVERPWLLLARVDQEDPGQPPALMLQAAACELADLADLLLDFRRLAAAQGCTLAGWMAPLQPEVQAALERAGFTPESGSPLWVFAKPRSENL